MKEFIELLKLYREYVITMALVVSGCLFVITYFAAKEALTTTQKTLSKVIEERQCWMNNRILNVAKLVSVLGEWRCAP